MKRLLIALVFLACSPLHAQQAVVDTMSGLRALAAPTTDGYEVKLRGYHQLGDNTPQSYRWSTASSAADDGGAVVNPTAHTGAGRWLLVWDGITANVRSWGAYFVPNVYVSDAAHDSLPAINAAIRALPIHVNDNCEQPAGASSTHHARSGQLYFPGGGPNQGYVVSGEIFCTAYMRMLGDGSAASLIGMLPGVATDVANPKYVIHYLYNNGPNNPNPNENFQTGIWGLSVVAVQNNAGCSGIKFLGSNGAYFIDSVAHVPLQGFVIDSKGVYFDRLITGGTPRGPGLEIIGTEITGGYADIEHVNFPGSGGGFARDAAGNLYPAVWIHHAAAFSIGTIATESSPLSVRITDSQFGVINAINANPNVQLYTTTPSDAGVVQFDGSSDGINILSMAQGPTAGLTSVRDTSIGVVNGVQLRRNVHYNPAAFRGSYSQDLNVYNLTASSLSLSGFFSLNSVGPISSHSFLIYQDGDFGVIGYKTAANGGAHGLLYIGTNGDLIPAASSTSHLGNGANPWGSVYANAFYGSGAGLTNIPASSVAGLTSASFGSQPTIYQTENYTLQDSDRGTRQVYAPAMPVQLTLGKPSKTAYSNGWYFLASNTGSVPMTLQAPAGATIDGQISISLPPRTQAVITSDGTNYFSSLAASGGERLVDFYELTQDAASLSFAIPPGFHHLHVVSDCRTTAALPSVLLAQVNGDASADHYVRNYLYASGGSVSAGQETSNPGLCIGQMNDPSAPVPAQNDTMISLGAATPGTSRGISAVTNGTVYLGGQPVLTNNAAQWKAPVQAGSKKTGSAAPATTLRPGNVVASLTVLPAAGNIAAGSTFYLYGY